MKRIGIIGAGQLGQMLGEASATLDAECTFLDPAPNPPAASVGTVMSHAFDDLAALRELAAKTDVITYEFENVPVAAIEALGGQANVYPPADALRFAQDRLQEKKLFESLGIPVAPYQKVDSVDDLVAATDITGLPLVLKTRRMGYDGKGQIVVRNVSEIQSAVETLGVRDLIAEKMIAFDREVSAIGARNPRGDVVFYPMIENQHKDGILDCSRAPAEGSDLSRMARTYLESMLSHLGYVGVLTIEFFVINGALLANEYAPRVHNSGHWSIEGARTSQFENHLRGVLDLPLGDTAAVGHSAMLNLIGSIPPGADSLTQQQEFATLHDYGKAARPGRKLGHITIAGNDPDERDRRLNDLRESLVALANAT